MKILLVGIGLPYHIGGFFKKACAQSGFNYTFLDEWDYFGSISSSRSQKIILKVLRKPAAYWKFNRDLLLKAQTYQPDVLLVTKGSFISPQTLARIRNTLKTILVNYATDDPFNLAVSTPDLRRGIPYFHLYVSTKRAIMEDISRAGCPSVIYVPFGYDPQVHFPQKPETGGELERFTSDLIFIGGADQDRLPIFYELTKKSDLHMSLYGGYWQKDPLLRKFYHGFAYGEEYRKALGGTKIGLCLVRRANRDGHVMRSFETPACGAFMLAERTEEHQSLFKEDHDVVLFSGSEELIDKAIFYANHSAERLKIQKCGYECVIQGNNTYQDRFQSILQAIK